MSMSEGSQIVAQPSDSSIIASRTNDENYRLSTFEDAMEGLVGTDFARGGFFYDSVTRQIVCFSCGISHPYSSGNVRAGHDPNCSFNNGRDRRNVPIDHVSPEERVRRSRMAEFSTSSRSERDEEIENRGFLFPCDNPKHPNMRSVDDRMRSFARSNWSYSTTRCTPRDIAEAGFFYLGPVDEVECWYCGGTLERWNYDDDPYVEHAKWHPHCHYVLQKKGIDYVTEVVSRRARERRDLDGRRRRSSAPSSHSTTTRVIRNNSNTINLISSNDGRGPRGINIFPEPNWEREDVEVPGVERRTVYRAPGITVTSTRNIQPQTSSSYQIITSNSPRESIPSQSPASSRGQLVIEAMNMGYSWPEIERVMLRRIRETGEAHTGINELLDDINRTHSRNENSGVQGSPRSGLVEETRSRSSEQTSSLSPRRSTEEISRSQPRHPEEFEQPGNRQSEIREVQSGPEHLYSIEDPEAETRPMITERSTCVTCGSRPADTVFLPCAHLIACQSCASLLNTCPNCDVDIESRVNVRN